MKFLADESFLPPALEALQKEGWDVFSIAESCPGISDDEVIAVCADQNRVLLTFDKDFGELVFRRVTPESPDDAAGLALALVDSQPDLAGTFCVVRRDRIRVRRMG